MDPALVERRRPFVVVVERLGRMLDTGAPRALTLPLLVLSLSQTWSVLLRVFGSNPFVFRAFGFGALSLAALLLVRAVASTTSKAIAIALLFFLVMSPMVREVQAIRPEPVMVALVISAAAFGHRFARRSAPWMAWVSAGSFLLAVLAKPIAIALALAMALFTLSRPGARVRFGTLLHRVTWFAVPGLVFIAWSHPLVVHPLRPDALIEVASQQFASWTLLPVVFAGVLLSTRRRDRALSWPFHAWLLGIVVALAALGERRPGQGQEALLLCPPLAWFGALGLGNVFELASGRARPSFLERSAAALTLPGLGPEVVMKRLRESVTEWFTQDVALARAYDVDDSNRTALQRRSALVRARLEGAVVLFDAEHFGGAVTLAYSGLVLAARPELRPKRGDMGDYLTKRAALERHARRVLFSLPLNLADDEMNALTHTRFQEAIRIAQRLDDLDSSMARTPRSVVWTSTVRVFGAIVLLSLAAGALVYVLARAAR